VLRPVFGTRLAYANHVVHENSVEELLIEVIFPYLTFLTFAGDRRNPLQDEIGVSNTTYGEHQDQHKEGTFPDRLNDQSDVESQIFVQANPLEG
jgi:hypothetical protein